MNIVIDENIEFAESAFRKYGNITLVHGREITNALLKNADALIIRSITKVDKNLLNETPVKFIGTATIGIDHLDIDYLRSRSITLASAPGCNSFAVAEYVITAFAKIVAKNNLAGKIKSVGIIGYGHIGSKVVKYFENLGYTLIINDPPLEKKGKHNINFGTLDEALKCDVITLHVPYTKNGEFPTHHLIDVDELNRIKEKAVLINTSRGGVVNNSALKNILKVKRIFTAFDVWENEPHPSLELVELCDISTPHIAGYSLEGKANGTMMIEKAFANFTEVESDWEPKLPAVRRSNIIIENESDPIQLLCKTTNNIYDIEKDSLHLKESLIEDQNCFDNLRKNYSPRREFSNYKIRLNNRVKSCVNLANSLRLKIV